MKSKAYRATDVKHIDLRSLPPNRQGLSLVVGIDVAKDHHLVVPRWADARFDRPWKVRNPDQLPCLLALLGQLRTGRNLVVALEPTGTYGDSLRQLLHDQGFVVHRVSPKKAHDYAEVFDGVPSQHDGKDAAVVAELAATGKSDLWPFVLDAKRQEMALWVHKLDLARRNLVGCYGRLEGLLARHWPEATGVLKLTTATLLRCLARYGGPATLACDSEALQRLQRWGGTQLQPAKAEKLVQAAATTLGVRQMPGDVRWLQENAEEALRQRQHMRECGRQLGKLAEGNEVIHRQAAAVGQVTACVLWVELGEPGQYHCAAAYRKAMGLNLAEYSSGRYKGELHLSKRGSAAVRRALYFATLRLVHKTAGVRRWYEQKKQRDEGTAKRALVGVMRRLALALYWVGQGQPFEARRLFAEVKAAAAGAGSSKV
jgi:transposase